MGAWGMGNFENDDALDWLTELIQERNGEVFIINSLQRLGKEDYADAVICCQALAAAEVVAALNGLPGKELPEKVSMWVSVKHFKPDRPLKDVAKEAVVKVKTDSELLDLWSDGGDPDEWISSLNDLLRRLA